MIDPAAGTINQAARGFSVAAPNSWSDVAPTAPSFTSALNGIGMKVKHDTPVAGPQQPSHHVGAHPPARSFPSPSDAHFQLRIVSDKIFKARLSGTGISARREFAAICETKAVIDVAVVVGLPRGDQIIAAARFVHLSRC